MKKFLKQFLFITIFSLSTLVLFIKLARGSIEPWHTVCFSSISTKDSINGGIEQIKKISEKYPQYFIQNTFINVRTEATNQTVYDGENPYRFTFRFWTLDGEKSFCIKSIQILNEDLNHSFENINFQSQIKHSKVLNFIESLCCHELPDPVEIGVASGAWRGCSLEAMVTLCKSMKL